MGYYGEVCCLTAILEDQGNVSAMLAARFPGVNPKPHDAGIIGFRGIA